MTDIEALADCIVSGQVPDECVPGLVAETSGLREELERRSSALSPAPAVEAGRGASISSPDGLRPADTGVDIVCVDVPRGARKVSWVDPHSGETCTLDITDFGDLVSQTALSHCLAEQEGRRSLKISGLLSKFLSSRHAPSFLRWIWSK